MLDEDGNSVGRQPAQRVHLEGLTHKAVYVFVFNDRGQLLLPRRPSDHWVCPDLFDISIAEHVPPGQSHREAAAAMLRHVYGLAHFELPQQPALPAHILHAELPGAYKEHVQAETYVVRGLAGDAVREAALDKSRVREAVFVDVADLQRMVEENNHEFTPW